MSAAIAVGIALRALVLVRYLATHSWQAETWEYEEIAKNLCQGHGHLFFHHGVPFRSAYMPVFPVVCAFLHKLAGPSLWLFYAFHLACAAAMIAAVHALARAIWDERVARVAAWLVAIEPGLIVYQSYKVDAVPLASLLLVLSLLALLRHARLGTSRETGLAGVLAGLATLTRPDMIVFWLAPTVWAAQKRFKASALRSLAIMSLAFAAVLCPWIGRNYVVHGRFMPATTLSGVNLWIGNNPNSTGTPWARSGLTQWQAAPNTFRAAIAAGPELAADDLYKQEALAYIKSHPVDAVGRWTTAFAYFWWFAPDYSNRYYYKWVPPLARTGYRLFYLALAVLIVLGTRAAARERTQPVAWFWACALGLAIMHSAYFVEGRHRLIVMPLLLIIAARGWVEARSLAR